MKNFIFLSFIVLFTWPAYAQSPGSSLHELGRIEPISIRPWLDHEALAGIRHGMLQSLPTENHSFFPLKRKGRVLDLGKPVDQFAFSHDGNSVFALLKGAQTLLHLSSETPPKLIKRYQLSAPSESIVVIRGFIVILQQQLGRLEFRPLSNVDKTIHWKPSGKSKIRGIGLSLEEERAPLIIWTRDLTEREEHYDFEFLDSTTLKSLPWKISRIEPKKNNVISSSIERQWDGTLESLKVSSDGLTAKTDQFKLTFLANHEVHLSFNLECQSHRVDYTLFRGKKLPFGLLGSQVRGISENCILVAVHEDEEAETIAVLDKESLTPLCLIAGLPIHLGDKDQSRLPTRRIPSKISLNENGRQIFLTTDGTGRVAMHQFDLKKIRKELPAQSFPSTIKLETDAEGRMTIPFCTNWQGDGHRFRLVSPPANTSINPDTGTVVITIPVNQPPRSKIKIMAEGQHRTGPKVALSCTIEIPHQ